MKRTIDSYFKISNSEGGSNEKSKETEETADLPSSSTDTSANKRYYNKQWEKKYSWLVYNEEKEGAFCDLCQNFMKNNSKVLQKECIEVRWLSHYRIVNAIFRSFNSIVIACEHIHKEGADLASLAGGILLKIRNESFFITCYVMNELLEAFCYLSSTLQKKDLCLSKVIPLLTSTKLHLQDIEKQCGDVNSNLQKNVRCIIKEKFEPKILLIVDEDSKETFKFMKEYCYNVVEEIENRFNDKSINIMIFASHFESFLSLTNIQDTEILQFCSYFPVLNSEALLADFRSFNFFINSMLDCGKYKADENPLIKIMEADLGYFELKKLCEILLIIPVTTASVERSYSSMNRILSNTRNRMLPETLMHCMPISIEGPEIPTNEFLDNVVDLYATKKTRRLRFI